MDETEKHKSILNTPMNGFWKGLLSALMVFLLAYPILLFELSLFEAKTHADYIAINIFLTPIYWIFTPLLSIILLYTLIGLIREQKWFLLPSLLISLMTILTVAF